MERLAAELGRKFELKDMGDAKYYMGCHITRDCKAHELKLDKRLYVKLMVGKLAMKKASRVPASSGVPTLSKADEPQTPEDKKDMLKVYIPRGSGSVHVDDNDDTAGHCVRGTRCGQVLEPWTGALLKGGDVGDILPASYERVEDHVRWAEL